MSESSLNKIQSAVTIELPAGEVGQVEVPEKSWLERCFQAIGFECLGLALSAPLFAWLLDKPLFDMGVITLINATLAMLWNVCFNAGFDAAQRRIGFQKTPVMRSVHAVGFELGLACLTVPIAMWYLDLGFIAAFLLDVGFLMFYMPYTYVYHWGYDVTRAAVVAKWAKKGSKRIPQV